MALREMTREGVRLITTDAKKISGIYFLTGAASSVFWKFGVQIVLLEILSVVLSPYFLYKMKSCRNAPIQNLQIRISIHLLCLWAFTQIFVDMYRGPELLERIKTLASIVTLICLLISARYLLMQSYSKIEAFLIGYFMSCVPTYFLFPTEYAKSQPWKFCFALFITFLVFWGFGRAKLNGKLVLLFGSSLVIIDFIFNSRALAVLTLFAIFWTLYNTKLNSHRPIISVLIIAITILIISRGSLTLASSGLLGAQVAEKTRAQSSAGPILLVARSEFLYEVEAIKENFLFGAGSNPPINISTLNKVWFTESELGINSKATSAYSEVARQQNVPGHSMMFTTWVEGGVFAVLIWIYLLAIFIKWFIWPLNPRHQLNYLCSLILITGIWSILFSPLGTGSRIQIAVTLVVGQFCNSKTLNSEST